MATPVDFPKYLQSLVESYKKQQHLYTLTDLQVEVRVEKPPEDRSQPRSAENKPETKIERLEVLAGLRKYVQQGNVLLVGKPGSGKSTVLQRFRWELALEALKEGDRQIPVLVQLRSDQSIVQAISAEFRQAKLRKKTWFLNPHAKCYFIHSTICCSSLANNVSTSVAASSKQTGGSGLGSKRINLI